MPSVPLQRLLDRALATSEANVFSAAVMVLMVAVAAVVVIVLITVVAAVTVDEVPIRAVVRSSSRSAYNVGDITSSSLLSLAGCWRTVGAVVLEINVPTAIVRYL